MKDRLAGDLVGQAHARREVRVVAAQSALRNAVGFHLFERRRRDRRKEGVFFVVNFSPWPAKEVLIVHAEVQRQPAADLVIVLRIEGQIALSQADLGGEGKAAAGRSAEEQLQIVRGERPAALFVEEPPQLSHLPRYAPDRDTSPRYYQGKDRYVENQKQHELVSVQIPVFLGTFKNEYAIRLAQFLAPFGDFVLRASFPQNLRLRNIPRSYLPNVFHLVRDLTNLAAGPRFIGNSIACTGADTCKLGICLSKGALSATAERLNRSALDLDRIADFKLNLSGCPNT